MKIFQIYVKGICVGTDNTEFKCFSRKVYKHEPTDEEKSEFVITKAAVNAPSRAPAQNPVMRDRCI